jgi:Fur family transcriptional regulator, ferric uptake regulator
MSCFATIKKNGIRLTPQRRMIVDLIHDRGDHFSAEDLISCIHGKMPEVNKSTIYRTLELLEKAGCIFKSESGTGSIYHHSEEGHHHHIICRKCGKSMDCQENLFFSVEKVLNEKYGFRANFQHMVIQGLCDSCEQSA